MVVARFPPSHRHACIHTFHMSSFRKLGDFFLSFSLFGYVSAIYKLDTQMRANLSVFDNNDKEGQFHSQNDTVL